MPAAYLGGHRIDRWSAVKESHIVYAVCPVEKRETVPTDLFPALTLSELHHFIDSTDSSTQHNSLFSPECHSAVTTLLQ